MGIQLPDQLQWVLKVVVGMEFPEGDEDECEAQSQEWRALHDQLVALQKELDEAKHKTFEGFAAGQFHDFLKEQFQKDPENFQVLINGANNLALSLGAEQGVAKTISEAKRAFWIALAALAATIALTFYLGPIVSGPAAAATRFALMAIVRTAVGQIIARAASFVIERAVLKMLVESTAKAVLTGAVVGSVGMAAGDAINQVGNMVFNGQDQFHWGEFFKSAGMGAVMGSVGGVFGGAAAPIATRMSSPLAVGAMNFGAAVAGNTLGMAGAERVFEGHVDWGKSLAAGVMFSAANRPMEKFGGERVSEAGASFAKRAGLDTLEARVDARFTKPDGAPGLSPDHAATNQGVTVDTKPGGDVPPRQPGVEAMPQSRAEAVTPVAQSAVTPTDVKAGAPTGSHAGVEPGTRTVATPEARPAADAAATQRGAASVSGAGVTSTHAGLPAARVAEAAAAPAASAARPAGEAVVPARPGEPAGAPRGTTGAGDVRIGEPAERPGAGSHNGADRPVEPSDRSATEPVRDDGAAMSDHAGAQDHSSWKPSSVDDVKSAIEHLRASGDELVPGAKNSHDRNTPENTPEWTRAQHEEASERGRRWHSLDPEMQKAIIDHETRPDKHSTLGDRDGLPGGTRDVLNRHNNVEDMVTKHPNHADAIREWAREWDKYRNGEGGQPKFEDFKGKLPETEPPSSKLGKVAELFRNIGRDIETRNIERVWHETYRVPEDPGVPRQLYIYEPTAFHGDGRVALSSGNLDMAHSIVVNTPGITTTIRSLEVNMGNAQNLQIHADKIWASQGKPELKTASLVWIGYDAPSGLGLRHTPRATLAEAGGHLLARDVAGLHAARVGDVPGIQLVGHSYGSTTTAFAARDGRLSAYIETVSLIGSPGAGPVAHAKDFHIGVENVFVGANSRDIVPMVGGSKPSFHQILDHFGLGRDPASEAFGARRFGAETSAPELGIRPTKPGSVLSPHTNYYATEHIGADGKPTLLRENPNVRVTESLDNLARIVTGNHDPLRIEAEVAGPRDPAHRFADPERARDAEPATGYPGANECARQTIEGFNERHGTSFDQFENHNAQGVLRSDFEAAWGAEFRPATSEDILAATREGKSVVAIETYSRADLPTDHPGGHTYSVEPNRANPDRPFMFDGDRKSLWSPHSAERIEIAVFNRDGTPVHPIDGSRGPQGDVRLGEPADRPAVDSTLRDLDALSTEKNAEIIATEKGLRPDPDTYLSPEYTARHLEKFDDGATRFMTESNFNKYGIAQRDGTSFVMAKGEVDALLQRTEGDPRAMERELGLPDGFFDSAVVRVDIPQPQDAGLRMPSGNEAGANDLWIPGGKLPTGLSEAVIDGGRVPADRYKVTDMGTNPDRSGAPTRLAEGELSLDRAGIDRAGVEETAAHSPLPRPEEVVGDGGAQGPRLLDENGAPLPARDLPGRCAQDANEIITALTGKDAPLAIEPRSTGTPARGLFEARESAAHFATYNEVHRDLLRQGDGALAILASKWSGESGGHAYVARNDGGVVHLYEKVGDKIVQSGWPPHWGEHAVDKTAVGYLDRQGNPLDPVDSAPSRLSPADEIGDVAGKRRLNSNGPGFPAELVTKATGHTEIVPRSENVVEYARGTHPEFKDHVVTETTRTVGNSEVRFIQIDGKTAQVRAELRDVYESVDRPYAENKLTRLLSKLGFEGGHVVGFRFALDQGELNLFRQAAHFNDPVFKKMENEFATWIKRGAVVDVVVDLLPAGVDPKNVIVKYDVFDRHGNQVYDDRVNFENNEHQSFGRLPTREIAHRLDLAERLHQGSLPPLADAVRAGRPHDVGEGWFRGKEHPETIDPDYGNPQAKHWAYPQNPTDPVRVTPEVANLISDPAAPFGRDKSGTPFTQVEYEQRFNKEGDRGEEWFNFPGNDGAMPGSRVLFTDVQAFKEQYGSFLDRIGDDSGRYLGVMMKETPASWEERAMHVDSLKEKYSMFTLRDLPSGWKIEVSEIAPGCGQPGGGLQVRIIDHAGVVRKVDELAGKRGLGVLTRGGPR